MEIPCNSDNLTTLLYCPLGTVQNLCLEYEGIVSNQFPWPPVNLQGVHWDTDSGSTETHMPRLKLSKANMTKHHFQVGGPNNSEIGCLLHTSMRAISEKMANIGF